MSIITINRFKLLLTTNIRTKTTLWLLFSLTLSIVLFRDSFKDIFIILSPRWIFGEYHVAPWGILTLCFAFLWLKRKKLIEEMNQSTGLFYRRDNYTESKTIIGIFFVFLALVSLAIFLPLSRDFLILRILLVSVAVFSIFFYKAVRLLLILLVIYGTVIIFPLMVQQFFENTYSQTAMVPLMIVMKFLGYQIEVQGNIINLLTLNGESIFTSITTACAGPTTMAVFLALYTLMVLDRPLPLKRTTILLVIGVIGTWVQSIIRLVLLMVVGYYLGENALWTAHYWTIYILFPLWYLIFVYIYFIQFKKI